MPRLILANAGETAKEYTKQMAGSASYPTPTVREGHTFGRLDTLTSPDSVPQHLP
jgi:hypothetical protein